ncbi:hypothetical protein OPT61_g518 [Boeremia exigua]|uniref:Uncharacterized protein n=1 Tax=Boeremia exigua TaxID=749465 RepID=A0ACC2ITM8_9PLEO|nr:hypothetical protein OPT61_g518 [Boeremia exigua]
MGHEHMETVVQRINLIELLLDRQGYFHVWWGRGVVARGVADVERREDSSCKEEQPMTCSEHNGSDTAVVDSTVTGPAPVNVAPQHRHGDEGCEPEQHSQELNARNGELVGGAREAGWGEPCPWVGVLVDKVRRETQHNDGEDHLDTANAQDDSWSDHFAVVVIDSGVPGTIGRICPGSAAF